MIYSFILIVIWILFRGIIVLLFVFFLFVVLSLYPMVRFAFVCVLCHTGKLVDCLYSCFW